MIALVNSPVVSGALSAFNNAMPFINFLDKAHRAATSLADIFSTWKARDELSIAEKVHVIFQSIFFVTQIVDIGVSISARNSHIHLSTTTAIGLADIARTNTRSYLNQEHGLIRGVRLTTLAATRTFDSLNVASELYPSFSGNYGIAARDTTNLLSTAARVMLDPPELPEIFFTGMSHVNNVLQPILGPIKKTLTYVGSIAKERRDALIDVSVATMKHIDTSLQPFVEPMQPFFKPIQSAFKCVGEMAIARRDELINVSISGVEYTYGGIDTVLSKCKNMWSFMFPQAQQHAPVAAVVRSQTTVVSMTVEEREETENTILQMLDYMHLNRIPRQYDNDERFMYRCKISNRSIRHIVIPNIVENTEHTPCYEKVELENWVRKKPTVAPEAWPVDQLPLPIHVGYIKVCTVRQQVIDTALRNIASAIRSKIIARRMPQTRLPLVNR